MTRARILQRSKTAKSAASAAPASPPSLAMLAAAADDADSAARQCGQPGTGSAGQSGTGSATGSATGQSATGTTGQSAGQSATGTTGQSATGTTGQSATGTTGQSGGQSGAQPTSQSGAQPAQSNEEPRRGPGRPPARPRGPRPEVLGVQSAPRDPANRFEFTHASPAAFKQLFAYLKNVRAQLIYFRCRRDGLTVFARDHSKSARVVASFDGASVNWHYSEGEFVLMFNRETVDRIFASIDRDVSLVTVVQSHGNLGELSVSFLGDEYDTDLVYAVQLSAPEDDPDLFEAEKALSAEALRCYPLAFTLSAARFRKIVTDLAANFEEFYIEKIASAPMQFAARTSRLRANVVFRRSDLIELESTTAAHEVFRVTVKVSAIKTLAMSMVTDSVRIHCRDDTNELVCRASLSDPLGVIVSTVIKF